MLLKTSALILALTAILGLELSNIYVSDHFEEPFKFKFESFVLKLAGKLVNF